MSTYQSVEWTCDRCGAKTIVGAHGRPSEQPPRWVAVHVVSPPLMNPTESDRRPDQICGDCHDSFNDWFVAGRPR